MYMLSSCGVCESMDNKFEICGHLKCLLLVKCLKWMYLDRMNSQVLLPLNFLSPVPSDVELFKCRLVRRRRQF